MIIRALFTLTLCAWVAFAPVSTEEAQTLDAHLRHYLPDDLIQQLVGTGFAVEWKPIKSKAFAGVGTLTLSEDFKAVLLHNKGTGKGPTIQLGKVRDTFHGPAQVLDMAGLKRNLGGRGFTLFTGKRQSAGHDFVAANPDAARTLFRVLDGVASFLHRKPAPIDLGGVPKKKYKDPESHLQRKKSFHAGLREEDSWLQEQAAKLKAEAKAEKRRLRKLREQQARDADEGEYNLRRLMIKIDYAVRDGEDTLPIAQQLAKACETAKKAKSGWYAHSVVYPNAVKRATEHGAPPYDAEAEAEAQRLDRVRRYQDAVLRLDKLVAGKVNISHAERIGVTWVLSNKTYKDEVLATFMDGINVTMADLIQRAAETMAPGVQAGAPPLLTEARAQHESPRQAAATPVVDAHEVAGAAASEDQATPGTTSIPEAGAFALAAERVKTAAALPSRKTARAGVGTTAVPAEAANAMATSAATPLGNTYVPNTAAKPAAGRQPPAAAPTDPPPSVCAVKLGRATSAARQSGEAGALAAAIQVAQLCAEAAGDMPLWVAAARQLLVQLTPPVSAAQGQQQCRRGEACGADTAAVERAASTHTAPKVQATAAPPPAVGAAPGAQLSSKQLRKFTSEVQSLVTRKAPSKLGKALRWIKSIHNGELTPEDVNSQLFKMVKATVDLSKYA